MSLLTEMTIQPPNPVLCQPWALVYPSGRTRGGVGGLQERGSEVIMKTHDLFPVDLRFSLFEGEGMFRPHPLHSVVIPGSVLRKHSWQCLVNYVGCWGMNPGWPCARQVPHLLYYCSSLQSVTFQSSQDFSLAKTALAYLSER